MYITALIIPLSSIIWNHLFWLEPICADNGLELGTLFLSSCICQTCLNWFPNYYLMATLQIWFFIIVVIASLAESELCSKIRTLCKLACCSSMNSFTQESGEFVKMWGNPQKKEQKYNFEAQIIIMKPNLWGLRCIISTTEYKRISSELSGCCYQANSFEKLQCSKVHSLFLKPSNELKRHPESFAQNQQNTESCFIKEKTILL